MLECSSALTEADGEIEKAIDILRTKTASIVVNPDKEAKEGLVHTYTHQGGKLAVMVEVNCATDFVGKSPAFGELVHNIALQIAASSPQWVSPEQVPQEVIDREKAIYKGQVADKSVQLQEKIAEGKLRKFFGEKCLMKQKSIKDDKTTVEQLVQQLAGQVKEPITIARFHRYQLGVS